MTQDDDEALLGGCARLPIFPLPRAVLLPRQVLPLHVFEPRYRALLAACLATDGLMAIATIDPSTAWTDDPSPRVWPEMGVGRVVHHERLPDGRSNLLLASIGAVRVVRELLISEPFRRVRAEPLPRVPDGEHGPAVGLRVLAAQAAARLDGRGAWPVFGLKGAAFVDALASGFLSEPDERRAYLVATSAAAREALVTAALLRTLDGGTAAEA